MSADDSAPIFCSVMLLADPKWVDKTLCSHGLGLVLTLDASASDLLV